MLEAKRKWLVDKFTKTKAIDNGLSSTFETNYITKECMHLDETPTQLTKFDPEKACLHVPLIERFEFIPMTNEEMTRLSAEIEAPIIANQATKFDLTSKTETQTT